jgi:hypothetical protein
MWFTFIEANIFSTQERARKQSISEKPGRSPMATLILRRALTHHLKFLELAQRFRRLDDLAHHGGHPGAKGGVGMPWGTDDDMNSR